MGSRVLTAIILGILGVVLLPSLKEPTEYIISLGGPYSAFVQLFTDNIYIVMVGGWILTILLLLFWRRRAPTDDAV